MIAPKHNRIDRRSALNTLRSVARVGLGVARTRHAAALEAGGRVLLVGGVDDSMPPSTTFGDVLVYMPLPLD